MNFYSRSNQTELLDRDDISFEAIKQNMHELDVINSLLGGHAITLNGFKKLAKEKKEITICEIGCGGGDNLQVLKKWCNKKNISATFIGIDINAWCIEYAKSKINDKKFQFILSDYRNYDFPERPDIIFSSLFCHHFNNEKLVSMLQWMKSNSEIGFFINDLHRNPLAYYSIKLLAKFFSKSYLVKNDAPISVLRGFQKEEWESLLQQSGISNYSLQWKWAFRWLIVVPNQIT
ncbi:MAG TPA: methyltransferase domain-containing protein [Puia sp.]|nr:methyltransferase domain-containing protein [Puia sp.]